MLQNDELGGQEGYEPKDISEADDNTKRFYG